MPGKLLKRLFGKKKPKSKEQLKKQRDAWHASDEYKQKVRDYKIKNQQGLVIKNKGTSRETLIQVKDVPRATRGFHKNKKYLKSKSTGGAVGPNGIL
jgi:hypothetical protein